LRWRFSHFFRFPQSLDDSLRACHRSPVLFLHACITRLNGSSAVSTVIPKRACRLPARSPICVDATVELDKSHVPTMKCIASSGPTASTSLTKDEKFLNSEEIRPADTMPRVSERDGGSMSAPQLRHDRPYARSKCTEKETNGQVAAVQAQAWLQPRLQGNQRFDRAALEGGAPGLCMTMCCHSRADFRRRSRVLTW
jgi:hypothetical protein